MKVVLVLLGVYVFLCLPFIGHLVCHWILHAVFHFDHFVLWLPAATATLLWLLIVSVIASLIAGTWEISVSLLLVLLIAKRVFSPH